MHQSIFQALGKSAANRLRGLADAASRSRAINSDCWTIAPEHLASRKSADRLAEEIRNWRGKGQKFIYFIDVDNKTDLSGIESAFKKAKDSKKGSRAYCSSNPMNHCLYVGRCNELPTRLLQHLGYGHEKTYALQLLHWARPLGLRFELHCAQYPHDTENEVLQAIEDQLWDEKKPMFGRRGSR